MIHILYSAFVYAAVVILSPVILWRMAANVKRRAGFWQKMGFNLPRQTRRTIWIHAVSVGETLAAVDLVRKLANAPGQRRILFSTTTLTGQKVAREKLAPDAVVFYFPYDMPCSAMRAASAINPDVLALVDTEIWPNVIRACKRRGAKIALINGRISDRSFPRYRKLRWLLKAVLADVSAFIMQSEADAERIIALGADPARVEAGGALKFDRATDILPFDERDELRHQIGAPTGGQVLLLGSVHEGEEAAIRAALEARKTRPGLAVVIAPRRIDDIGWIERAVDAHGLRAVRKTSLNAGVERGVNNMVVVVDTFGELSRLYGAADVAFVGGSLIPHGGQNPLEPAAMGVAPVFGPHMSNFREASEALLGENGAFMAESEEELLEVFNKLLEDGETRENAGQAARAVVERNKGATGKTFERIMALANE